MTGPELLRRAVDNEPVPRDLHARVRSRLDARHWTLTALLAATLACTGFLFAFTQVYAISMLRIGVRDHIHCAVGGRYSRQTDASEMGLSVGREFAPLIQPILQRTGGPRLISAHQCYANNRRYVHFVLEGPEGLTSVSVTKRRPLEWIPGKQQRRLAGYTVAAFEEDDYLVFVSSPQPNRELTEAFEQILSYHL